MRYQAGYDPALVGVSFEVKPGEVIAIMGKNGSGKSTILKITLGIYQPQAGNVRLDNHDIRQINPISLRTSIAYLPQIAQLFFGTLAQNLRLVMPMATDQQLVRATKLAGIFNDIMALPDQFNTSLKDSNELLSGSFVQQFCLARAYLKETHVMLLDEPGTGLDFDADKQFMATINKLRGDTTILLVTHRPSHIKMADRVFYMEQGQLLLQGPPQAVLSQVAKELI